MTLGLLLWVSSTCLLLFDGSSGLPAKKGYINGYSHGSDSLNLAEEYSSYDNPSVEQQPDLVPVERKLPYTPSLEVERSVDGKPIEWAPEDLDKPLLFPLNPIFQLRDLAFLQPSSRRAQSSLNVASSSSIPRSLSSDDSTHYASVTDYYEPASIFTSLPDLWQPELVGEGYVGADLDSDSSNPSFKFGNSDRNNRRLVFEEVFQFPSEYTGSTPENDGAAGYIQVNDMSKGVLMDYASTLKKPSFPSHIGDVESRLVYTPGMRSSFPSRFTGGENLSFGQTSYQPHSRIPFWLPQKTVTAAETEVSQRKGEPNQNYVIYPRADYHGARYLLNKSWRSPELPPLEPMNLAGDKKPAESTSDLKSAKIAKEPMKEY